MSFLYAVLLAAVAAIVVAEIAAVVRRVSSAADWSRPIPGMRPALVRIDSDDRRREGLPYVGRDRRASVQARDSQGDRRRA